MQNHNFIQYIFFVGSGYECRPFSVTGTMYGDSYWKEKDKTGFQSLKYTPALEFCIMHTDIRVLCNAHWH